MTVHTGPPTHYLYDNSKFLHWFLQCLDTGILLGDKSRWDTGCGPCPSCVACPSGYSSCSTLCNNLKQSRRKSRCTLFIHQYAMLLLTAGHSVWQLGHVIVAVSPQYCIITLYHHNTVSSQYMWQTKWYSLCDSNETYNWHNALQVLLAKLAVTTTGTTSGHPSERCKEGAALSSHLCCSDS